MHPGDGHSTPAERRDPAGAGREPSPGRGGGGGYPRRDWRGTGTGVPLHGSQTSRYHAWRPRSRTVPVRSIPTAGLGPPTPPPPPRTAASRGRAAISPAPAGIARRGAPLGTRGTDGGEETGHGGGDTQDRRGRRYPGPDPRSPHPGPTCSAVPGPGRAGRPAGLHCIHRRRGAQPCVVSNQRRHRLVHPARSIQSASPPLSVGASRPISGGSVTARRPEERADGRAGGRGAGAGYGGP